MTPPPGSLYRSIRAGVSPAAKALLFKTGALGILRAVRPSNQLAILRYHAICGSEGYAYASPGICTSPRAFEAHIKYLTSEYSVVPLPDAVTRLRQGTPLPPNAVAITFDDGYADNLPAARTLARHGVSATFYLTAGCLDGGQPFWPAELRYLLTGIEADRITLRAGAVQLEMDLSSGEARARAVNALTGIFKAHPIPVREELRSQLRACAHAPRMPRVMLTWDEVREMHALGMTIGSHTMTHPNLPSAGPAAARSELVESRDLLEHEVGAAVTMFSYPNGGAERYMTPEIAGIVRGAGFEAATTSWNGFAGSSSDLFALERVQVEERVEDLAFALEVERFVFKPAPRHRGGA